MQRTHAIILNAGNSERMGYETPKQFLKIAGKTVLEHTLDVFDKSSAIDNIIVVTNPIHRALTEEIILRNNYYKINHILNGGASRQESSYIGIRAIEDDKDFVLVHDAVRPFVTERILSECVSLLSVYEAVDVAIPADDTIIELNQTGFIKHIPKRSQMWLGQTPQAFHVGLIKKAHLLALSAAEKPLVTDDCGLITFFSLGNVFVLLGDRQNIKITYPEDVTIAEKIFQVRALSSIDAISSGNLTNKTIVVFGGNSGIGQAIAIEAQRRGGNVYVFSRSNGVDISNIQAVENALLSVFKQEGKVDHVVNSAGILKMGPLWRRSIDDISDEILVNYVGSINILKASFPYLKETKGSVLLFSSSSYTRGRPLYAVYSSTKAAIVNLCQGVAEEFISSGVRINVINPERTATPMRFANFGKEPEGSLLSPSKVAKVAMEILGTDITGQVFNVTKQQDFTTAS